MSSANRRDLLIAPLLAAIPAALLGDRADASPIDPGMTFTRLPDQIVWEAGNVPPKTVEQAPLWGKTSEPGLYYTLVRWYPGFHERAALVRDRPAVRRGLRHLVGGERGGFCAGRHGSDAGGELHPPRGAHAALRRGQEGQPGARGDRDLRHGTDNVSCGGSEQAECARAVSERV